MSVVPMVVRPHLVPFFFKESDGEEAAYGNKRVKASLFSPHISSFGRVIRLLMVKAGCTYPVENFNMFLTISDFGNGKAYKGEFYKCINGKHSFLKLPKEANDDINDMMEDMFRMSFISYMNGCIENNGEAVVVFAIDKFIDKYDLLEFGYTTDTLRQLYYREKKNNKILSRFQAKKSPKILNYSR